MHRGRVQLTFVLTLAVLGAAKPYFAGIPVSLAIGAGGSTGL